MEKAEKVEKVEKVVEDQRSEVLASAPEMEVWGSVSVWVAARCARDTAGCRSPGSSGSEALHYRRPAGSSAAAAAQVVESA